MQIAESLEKAVKVGAAVVTTAVAVAELLTNVRSSDKPIHLAVYLIGRTWPEVLVALLTGAIIYFIGSRLRLLISRSARIAGGMRRGELRSPRYFGLSFLILLLAIQLTVPVWYAVRARIYYWKYVVLDEYVESYEHRIDVLAARGRMRDAWELAKLVKSSTGKSASGASLDERLYKLGSVIQVAEKLAAKKPNQWNAVTGRADFFNLVEAVRLNPQNYGAADHARELVNRLRTQYLVNDAKSICSGTPIEQFRGWATSTIEAQIRRLEASSPTFDCASIEIELHRAWMLSEIDCVLAVSGMTRKAASIDELASVSTSKVQGCQEYSFPRIAPPRKFLQSWSFPTLADALPKVLWRVRDKIDTLRGGSEDDGANGVADDQNDGNSETDAPQRTTRNHRSR